MAKYKNPLTGEWENLSVAVAMAGGGGVGVSVKSYGAKGNGITNDTVAFKNALAENRVVFVPGGKYILSDTIRIGENSKLELSQDTVLEFTQTDKDCIEMPRLSNLAGNHATINVPYTFNAKVICASTEVDTGAGNEFPVEPFEKWSPQWSMSRYVTDINICKAEHRGFHYSVDGDCYGTALYIYAKSNFLWGIDMSGIRIAGGFTYGIHILNELQADGSYQWNHDMRLEAVIDACENGVVAENCNNAHLAVTIQPRRALKADGATYVPYAKHGIKLNNCLSCDLSQAVVWDWNSTQTLYGTNEEYKFLALYGDCAGTILNDFSYYQQADVRLRIYTNLASNLEKITILQEPFTRWFKPVDGEPYFFDGRVNKKLMLTTDKFYTEQMEFIENPDGYYTYEEDFTDVKAPYTHGKWFSPQTLEFYTSNTDIWIEPKEFKNGDVVRIRGINFESGAHPFICFWNKSDGIYKGVFNMASLIKNGYTGSLTSSAGTYEWDNVTYTLTIRFNSTGSASFCDTYKFSINGTYASGYNADKVVLTLNEEIEYNAIWHGEPKRMDESIYAQNVFLKAPNGTGYKLTVGNDGTVRAEAVN